MGKLQRIQRAAMVVAVAWLATGTYSSLASAVLPTLQGVTGPGLASVSTLPKAVWWLNLPTEYDVVPDPPQTGPAPNSVLSSTTSYRTVSTPVWSNVTHYARYWATSGYWATGWRWVKGIWVRSNTEYPPPPKTPDVWNPYYHDCGWRAQSIAWHWPYHAPVPPGQTACWQFGWYAKPVPGHWQSYRYWVNTSHWQSYRYWVNTSHWQWYYYTIRQITGYTTTKVPVVTTVTATNVRILSESLASVWPEVVTADHQLIQGYTCFTPTTPLYSSLAPGFPDYSLHPRLYTGFFYAEHICSFDPARFNDLMFEDWVVTHQPVNLVITPTWNVTISYTKVTTVSGTVISSVPETASAAITGTPHVGPALPIKAILGVPCVVFDGQRSCSSPM